ncbi:DUF1848 domain-containing protein [Pantoea agglomerans]|uniref:DUF1848 domain-containing protein n=1 Tax=Enterobacter agglomerans TaxID=549 RepID=UPI00289AA2EF|nr:DUF1848 domain-containing protein [Pantoea agglomerans]WNK36081.1 DUF1848 domain-containing protein [Pantoea agglomerans]
MIISASRRTDIPAFYTPWFMNRIREGFLLTRNPFNYNQIKRVSLSPSDVDVIVFWTRNPRMLMNHLDELDSRGFRYYFQYTITGYPRVLESSVPRPHRAIETFTELSDRIGRNRVVWRYDPILVSNLVDFNEHKRLFKKIAGMLSGKTNRVVISFADFYKKTERNLNEVSNLVYYDIVNDRDGVVELALWMKEIATEYGMEIESCSEDIDLSTFGIQHGKCIDNRLINDVFDLPVEGKKDNGQRDACGCVKSVDIGSYNTCLHECAYCYATFNKDVVKKNKNKHYPNSPFLIGDSEGVDPHLLSPVIIQQSLF